MSTIFGKEVSNTTYLAVVFGLSSVAAAWSNGAIYHMGANLASRYSFLNNRFLNLAVWWPKTVCKLSAKLTAHFSNTQLALASAVSLTAVGALLIENSNK